jgi:CheY-like chemotaxis protein
VADILVVDDEEADRVQIAAALKPAGHKLHFAVDGAQALRSFLERTIHVVVTDIVMPGGSGLTLIADLKALKPDVPIIAISGKGPGGLSAASAIGADAVIIKPFAPAQLVRAVGDALDRAAGGMSRRSPEC